MDKRPTIIRFGQDGWHARYADGFDEANVVRIADALGFTWAESMAGGVAYVGYDTRSNMAHLAHAAASAIAAYGLRVVVSDRPCPTPAVSWTCANDKDAVGVMMLTASSRSCEYGGVLVRSADGGPCDRGFLDDVEQTIAHTVSAGHGSYEGRDILGPYEDDLAAAFDGDAIAGARLRVVVDPMYGSGAGALARVLRRLGCEVLELHNTGESDFDGIHPEPENPWADDCERSVVEHEADFGILLDGDADRLGVVDEKGGLLPVRTVVPLILEHLVERRGQTGRVVSTLTSSACVSRQAEHLGCRHLAVPVSFARIYREACEGDVVLGAEEYGGVCVPSHLLERDGLYAALLMTELIAKSGLSVTDLVARLDSQIGTMYYARRDVRLESAATQAFRNILPGLNPAEVAGRHSVEVSHADGLRLQFSDDAWVLMRPSRASSIVRVYAEAHSGEERDALLSAACDLVKKGI